MIQARTVVQNNTVSSPENPLASKKALCVVITDQLLSLFERFLLLHFLTWKIQYWYLYTKNYKTVNIYRQVFCYPESINTSLRYELYAVHLQRVLWELGTVPPFFYYELLIPLRN